MLSIVFVLAGGVAVFTLPVAQYPEVTPPTVLVTALYPGANAQTVRDTVAAPIEEQVSGVEGMMYMSSQSTNDGTYRLTGHVQTGHGFRHGPGAGAEPRLAGACRSFPVLVQNEGISVKKISPNTMMIVNLVSPDGRYDGIFLSNYATIYIRDELGRLPGVADITYFGQRDYSLRAWLDPDKLASLGLSATDVVDGHRPAKPASGRRPNRPGARPQGPAIPVDHQHPRPADRPGAVCRHHRQGRQATARGARRPASGSAVRHAAGRLRQPRAQHRRRRRRRRPTRHRPAARRGPRRARVAAVRSVLHARRPAVGGAERLPASRHQRPGNGRSGLRQDGRAEGPFPRGPGLPDRLRHHAFHPRIGQRSLLHAPRRGDPGRAGDAGVLAELAGGDHPLGGRAGGHHRHLRRDGRLGFSLNNLSLFGLVLAIGIVVDDAIVVVENIERWLDEGVAPREAARKAMDEVTGPVIAVGLVLFAVFIPAAFLGGISGQFFRQFAVTIAVSTVISAFNSLTLSPALAAILLRPRGAHRDPVTWLLDMAAGLVLPLVQRRSSAPARHSTCAWSALLRVSLMAMLVYGGLLVLTYGNSPPRPTGFIPQQDKGICC